MTEGEEFAMLESRPGDRALRVQRLVLISCLLINFESIVYCPIRISVRRVLSLSIV